MKTTQMTAGMLVLTGLAFPLVAAAAEPASGGDEGYVVFVGLASEVDVEGRIGEIRDCHKEGVEIAVDDRRVVVPHKRVQFVNTRHAPKVAMLEVQVRPVESFTWLTPTLDPRMQAMSDANRLIATATDQVAISNAKLLTVQENNAVVRESIEAGDPNASPDSFQDETPFYRDVQQNVAMLDQALRYDNAAGPGVDESVPGDRYTNIFEISSEQEMTHVYAIGLLVIRTVEAPAKPVYTLRLQRLPSVGPKPKRVSIEFFGLPMGFAVDRFELHVFAGGIEVATSVSKGRVSVNRSEAYELLLVQYLVDHKDDRLPPAIVRELLRSEPALARDQMGRFAKVKVDRNGRVTGVSLAPIGDQSADAQLEALVRDTLFYPALVDGEQVDGEVEITLGQLAI